ncbi:transcriptional regulator [Nocardiopsis terrae]|uniref:Transcriptional regulator with XRE-family HTH domain n=1 Tax=Nocardiopsis terrae TaxID=372655 RepID=A0ABR9HGK5_9ACTN|nr:helix-turn-helix transcriptional regulator [Nocardiopsis terrae]MBE1458161.1 transcriptional regulator with XRE-family HTH domain [Nocardiopsis terrae]GHC81848.1 transcriptional regulator [Nocardiopsis terrae]
MVRHIDPAWRTFGRSMRGFRDSLGLRQADVADAIGVVISHYSSWETGKRRPDPKYVNHLDEELQASGRLVEAWEKANRQVQTPMRFAELPDLEAASTQIREYQPLVFPGLIQTAEYARAVFEDTFPGMSADRVDQLVRARMDRQEILDRDPRPLIILLITEGVLHQQVGGRGLALLRDQRRRLLADAEAGRVRAQIIPRDTGRHYGNGGAFRLYTFAGEPPVASAEYMTGEIVISDPERHQECLTSFGLLQGEALPEAATLKMLQEMVNDNGN